MEGRRPALATLRAGRGGRLPGMTPIVLQGAAPPATVGRGRTSTCLRHGPVIGFRSWHHTGPTCHEEVDPEVTRSGPNRRRDVWPGAFQHLSPTHRSRLFRSSRQHLDHPVPHHEFLRLSGDRHWQLVNDPDVLRNLEVSYLSLQGLTQLLAGNLHPWLRNYLGADFLAEPLIRDAEDLGVVHLRMADHAFLDLARVDVLAAPDDHVLHATDYRAEALFVERGEIA